MMQPLGSKRLVVNLKPAGDQKTVATLILEQLQLWGVKRIYGVIGDAIFGLMDAIGRQVTIQFIAVKHESVAAMMASAEAKLTGNIGVCISQMGPGLGNLLNGLGDAYFDTAPVLVISGQAPLDKVGTDYHQYLDQQAFVLPIARFSTLAAHPDAVPEILAKAMRVSSIEGTVTHVSIPQDLFTLKSMARPWPRPTIVPYSSSYGNEDLKPFSQIMNAATRPMIVVGSRACGAGEQIENLAASWGAGIATSINGIGTISPSCPWLLGGIGPGGNPHLPNTFVQCDVALLIGTTHWPQGYVPTNALILQLDEGPAHLGRGIPIQVGAVANVRKFIVNLSGALARRAAKTDWIDRIQEVRRAWTDHNEHEGGQDGHPVPPARIVRAIENNIDQDAIITLDYGDSTLWFYRTFRAAKQRVLVSEHWRTMGFGLPAALAAKLCMPDRQVVAIVGDGGLGMTLADLLTATRYNLKLTVVLFNNGALQMERDKMTRDGYARVGTSLTNPDFVQLARSCDWDAFRVELDVDLEEVLKKALVSAKPALVDVCTAAATHPDFLG